MNDSLKEQFLKIVESGDEKATKRFLITHIKEFSEETQDGILTTFFEDALQKKAGDINRVTTIQKNLLAELEEMEKVEQTITDKKKESEVKEQLGL